MKTEWIRHQGVFVFGDGDVWLLYSKHHDKETNDKLTAAFDAEVSRRLAAKLPVLEGHAVRYRKASDKPKNAHLAGE